MQCVVVMKEHIVVNILGWFYTCPDYCLKNFSAFNKTTDKQIHRELIESIYMESHQFSSSKMCIFFCFLHDHDFVNVIRRTF